MTHICNYMIIYFQWTKPKPITISPLAAKPSKYTNNNKKQLRWSTASSSLCWLISKPNPQPSTHNFIHSMISWPPKCANSPSSSISTSSCGMTLTCRWISAIKLNFLEWSQTGLSSSRWRLEIWVRSLLKLPSSGSSLIRKPIICLNGWFCFRKSMMICWSSLGGNFGKIWSMRSKTKKRKINCSNHNRLMSKLYHQNLQKNRQGKLLKICQNLHAYLPNSSQKKSKR